MLEPDEGLSPAHKEDTGPTASGKWGRRAHGQLEVRKPTWFESWDSQAPCVVWLVGGREGAKSKKGELCFLLWVQGCSHPWVCL